MLARKINRPKWDTREYLEEDAIRADAMTKCLCTSDDALSWWRCEGDENGLEEVALALATGPKSARVETIFVATLPVSCLEDAGMTTRQTPGKTAVDKLKSRHVNVVELDIEGLATIAKMLAPRIRGNKLVKRFTRKRLTDLIKTAIEDKRLDPAELHQELREKLGL